VSFRNFPFSSPALYFMVSQPLLGQGLLITETLRLHSDTPYLVGIIWRSDQPVAEISSRQNIILPRCIHLCSRRDSNLQSHALDGAATGIGSPALYVIKIYCGHAFLHPTRGLNCTFLEMYSDNLMFAHVPLVWVRVEAKQTCILW
jgi:hypothetical protein